MRKTILILALCLAFTAAGSEANFLNGLLGGCTCSSIQSMVAESEGTRSCVYKDSLGIKTIGIGFNLEKSGAKATIQSLGLNYDSVCSGATCLTQAQITSLFNTDLEVAQKGVRNCVPTFNSQPGCIQNVLVDMTFNMGPASLCSWPNFVSQIGSKDYSAAATNMKGTKWCSQVGNRCTRDVNIVKSC